jgi:hypothetical protein
LIYDRIPNKVVEPEKFVIPNTIGCTIITPSNMASPTAATPASSFPNLPASVTATPVQQPLPSTNKRKYDPTSSDRKSWFDLLILWSRSGEHIHSHIFFLTHCSIISRSTYETTEQGSDAVIQTFARTVCSDD